MQHNERELTDFQENWNKLVDKGSTDYDSLTRDERVWFNIQILMGDVVNGGLISHYYNFGADRNLETIEDLQYLGQHTIAAFLIMINSFFPEGQPSRNIDERNNIIEKWTDEWEHNDLLEMLDNKFYEAEKRLESRLIDHILQTGLSK